MLKFFKFSLLGFWIVFLFAGLNHTQAQVSPVGDSVDQKIARLQKEIDAKGYHWIAQRNWTSELSD